MTPYSPSGRRREESKSVSILSQRTHDAITPSLLRQNDFTTSFWRNNDVIIASCMHWDVSNERRFYTLLTNLPWTKWSPFRRRYFQMYFREWKFCILIKIWLKFVPKGPVDNNPALVKITAWHRIDPIHCRIYAALGGDELKLTINNFNDNVLQ